MSRPRTRSQGPPETEIIDDGEEAQHIVNSLIARKHVRPF